MIYWMIVRLIIFVELKIFGKGLKLTLPFKNILIIVQGILIIFLYQKKCKNSDLSEFY